MFQVDRDNWYVNNLERLIFRPKNEALREIAHTGLINKQQLIQFDLLNGERWQANIEAKQGGFHLNRYLHFVFSTEISYIIHGSMIGP